MTSIPKKQPEESKQNSKPESSKTAETKAVAKRMTTQESRDFLKRIFKADCDPDYILKDIPPLVEDLASDDKKIRDKAKKELEAKSNQLFMINALDTHYQIAETVNTNYRPLIIEFVRQIEREYECKTTSEKALAETTAIAYGKVLEYSKYLNNCTRSEFLSAEKNGYYSMMSKELDRANRQFLTSLTMLRNLKQPPIEISVKAKNAFVAQNQQINVEKPTETIVNENQ